jgi:NADPH-dependent ferric siderophore reductase
MQADVSRVARVDGTAFLFVIDEAAYDSFSDDKAETRGRKAVYADWFRKSFPEASTFRANGYCARTTRLLAEETDIDLVFHAQRAPDEAWRYVVAGSAANRSFATA